MLCLVCFLCTNKLPVFSISRFICVFLEGDTEKGDHTRTKKLTDILNNVLTLCLSVVKTCCSYLSVFKWTTLSMHFCVLLGLFCMIPVFPVLSVLPHDWPAPWTLCNTFGMSRNTVSSTRSVYEWNEMLNNHIWMSILANLMMLFLLLLLFLNAILSMLWAALIKTHSPQVYCGEGPNHRVNETCQNLDK